LGSLPRKRYGENKHCHYSRIIMRIESEFKKAFLLSGMLHVLFILIFNITLLPSRDNLKKPIQISFYGNMLVDLGRVESQKDREGYISVLDKRIKSLLAEKISSFPSASCSKETFYVQLEKPNIELSGSRKPLPYFKRKDLDFINLARQGSSYKTEAKKELDLRNLIFSKLPYSEFAYAQDEANFNFKMRILVSPEGKVEFVEPLVFSGKPELDIQVKKAIKEWSFLPDGNTSGWYEIDFNPKLATR